MGKISAKAKGAAGKNKKGGKKGGKNGGKNGGSKALATANKKFK